MEINAEKFMNVVVEKTTQKMNAFQGQIIILEAQLQLAVEKIQLLEAELNKLNAKKEEPSNGKTNNKTGTY